MSHVNQPETRRQLLANATLPANEAERIAQQELTDAMLEVERTERESKQAALRVNPIAEPIFANQNESRNYEYVDTPNRYDTIIGDVKTNFEFFENDYNVSAQTQTGGTGTGSGFIIIIVWCERAFAFHSQAQ
jgi:hypothetical protein